MDEMIRSALQYLDPVHRIEAFKEHPVSTQRTLLRNLLSQAADTEWGRRFGFAEIANASNVVAAYQERVPLHTYDDIEDDVLRVREGASDVMWPGTITNFAVSSGTVSDGKIIPISQQTIDYNRDFSVGTGLHYLKQTLDGRFFLGSHLTLPGRVEEDPNYPGTLAGEISGILAENAPNFFSNLYQAVPNEVSFISNWEEKLRAIAERTVDQDIRLLVMVPSWAIVLFDQLIELYNERNADTVTTVGEIWPNLQVFIAGGVPLRSYRDLLEEKIGADVDFIETYGASEGFFSFQDDLEDPSMLLHLDNGVFYEFVRLDEKDEENPPRYTIADVEPDVRYSLYVTSSSGLWAYEVGDVIRFTSTFPHKITVAGRTSEMIDEYGEALYGDEARAALRHACDETGAHVVDYHIAPRGMTNGDRPGHEWLIEFEEPPADLDAFSTLLDEYLQDVNRHYQIRREAHAFDAPAISAVPEGAFYDWLKATKDDISGQTKVPRMSDSRTVADGILEILDRKN
ncbi:GH3 auxin-responsive promoter [Salinibacter sp. 10B]|uniref:GH3 auxin-responsive promoter family protein n=1 Tax=Salinibacter sp. 10B TaxID=1923971 RepID=UPI000CF4A2B6|nr:GH3 auxin-responsive promoter family protein [Salinibacter sp. 10B]PQJ36164.1 GH3 auxin-responsive promoter [Salinibacter sp. 10B]